VPRIRTIKPEIWEDEVLGRTSVHARLLFVGLISQADDEGRLRGASQRISAAVFPYDEFSAKKVDNWLAELERAGLIVRYETKGQRFVALPNFPVHQRINRATSSKLPPPPTEPSSPPHVPLSEDSHPEGIKDQGRDQGTPPTPLSQGGDVFAVPIDDPDWLPPYLRLFRPQGPDAPPVEALFCLWRDLYEHHDSAFDDAKRKAIRDALATYPPERVARAIAGGMLDPHLRGENEDRRKYDGLGTLLRLGKRGKRNNVEHLSELFDEKEPRFKDEPWEVAMQNAVAHRAWQREAWAVLEEQELWLARHGRRLRVDASAKWQRFVDETGYDATQLRVVA
jgi:hypothetical protein